MGKRMRDIPCEVERYRDFKARGIEKVKWITAEEDRGCEICRARDGQVYTLDEYMNLEKCDRCQCTIKPQVDRWPVIFHKIDRVPLRVIWISMGDPHVCSTCAARHGQIYTFAEYLQLDKHTGCRCEIIEAEKVNICPNIGHDNP